MLHLTRNGSATARPPLVIAHGLFGTGRNWGTIARALSDQREVIAVDMRNHGASDWTETHDYPGMAADLAEVIEQMPGGRAAVMGHSMGGKATMVLALTRPDLVERLVVADIAPVAYPHHGHDEQFAAMRAVDPAQVTTRAEAAALMTMVAPAVAAFLLQSLDMVGRRWRLNIDLLEREMPVILDFPAVGSPYAGPTLFLAGAKSDYIRPEHHPAIHKLFPEARITTIADAGHWLHAEQPQAVLAAMRGFLDEG